MASQLAIGTGGRVSLWCHRLRTGPDGAETFEVINGEWRGSIRDGLVTVESHLKVKPTPGEVLWRGKAPFGGHDYNEAIRWIEAEIAQQPAAEDA